MPPSYRPIFRAFLKTAFTGVALPDCEILLLNEGGTFWAAFTATAAIFGEDDQKRCRFCFSDITARRQSTELSSRELEVLRLIADGKANKQIASELVISMRTVEKHRAHLMEKLNIHDTAGLTRHAMDSGIMTGVVAPTPDPSGKVPGLFAALPLLPVGESEFFRGVV
jgi:DNA-binding CsgD family transcriptional regulator